MLWRHLRPLNLHRIFRHYLINGAIFGKTLLKIKHVFWFSLRLLSKPFLNIKIIQRDITINVKSLHVKYPLFLSLFNETWIFSADLRKVLKYLDLHKNPYSRSRVVPCGQTDMMKVVVVFRNFANAPKNRSQYRHKARPYDYELQWYIIHVRLLNVLNAHLYHYSSCPI